MSNRTLVLLGGGAACALFTCLGFSVLGVAIYFGTGTAKPTPPPTPTQPPSRMDAFFAEHGRAERALSTDDLKALAGSWEARYVSFHLDDVPVDTSKLPPLALAIRPAAGSVRLEANGVTRELVLDGARLLAKGNALPELALRVAGDELVGEVRQRSGESSVHAEFRARRK